MGVVAVKNRLLAWPTDWSTQAIAKCYRNAIKAFTRDERRVDVAIARLQQGVEDGRFISTANRKSPLKIGGGHYGVLYTYKGRKVVGVLDTAFDLISGDKSVTEQLITRLEQGGVCTGGHGHARTTQIPVPVNVNGKRIEKPRLWLFDEAKLKAFGRMQRKRKTTTPSSAQKSVSTIDSAKRAQPNIRKRLKPRGQTQRRIKI